MKRTLIVLLALGAVAAHAQNLTASAGTGLSSSDKSGTAGPVNASTSSSFEGSFSGSAIADYGVLKAYGTATPSGTATFSNYHFGQGQATFQDGVTFSNDALVGQTGYVTFKWSINGTLSANGGRGSSLSSYNQAAARFSLSMNEPGSTSNQELRNQVLYGNGETHSFLNTSPNDSAAFVNLGEQTTRLSFVFGRTENLVMSLGASGATYDHNGGFATADLAHSAYWGGIASVTDASGNFVDYSLSSVSGRNWAQPVPEPTSLAALGLGALGLLRRRCRKSA